MLSSITIILFKLSLFTLCLGQLAILARLGDFKLYVFDLVVSLYAVLGCYLFIVVKKNFYIGKPYVYFIFFVAWAILTLPFGLTNLNDSQVLASIFYLARFIIYLVAVLVTSNLLKMNILGQKTFLTHLFNSSLFIAVAGFVQLILIPDFTKLDPILGLDPHKNRLASTFLDPNFAGGYLSLVVAIAIGSYLFEFYRWDIKRFILYILIPISAIFLTFSRSSWAMLAVSIFIYGIFKSRVLLILSLLIIFGAYFAVPRVQTRISGITDPADSAAFRLTSWQNAISISKDNLLFGVGYNTYRYIQRDYGFIEAGESGGNSGAGADSSLLLVLATTGLVGFVFFVFPIFKVVLEAFFVKWNLVLISVFGSLLLHSQFVNSLFYPPMLFIWPILMDLNLLKVTKKTFDK
ncbi:O-antigen ligase family protein [candidate division WWE3 bacterium]|nr:O-antigen ligase family protein [candidate division WWE3 bacterium]